MTAKTCRIAVVIPKYGLAGGAEGFAAEVTERLAWNPRYEIHVLARKWKENSPGVTFRRIPRIPAPRFAAPLIFAWLVKRMISTGNYDLVHTHERIFEADLYTLHGVPHRFWVDEVRRKRRSLADYATDWVEKRIMGKGRCRYYLAVSRLVKEKYLEVFPRLQPAAIEVIHPGIDPARFEKIGGALSRQGFRAARRIGDEEIVILFVSMNFEVKGLDALLSALALIKKEGPVRPFKLLVVGKGRSAGYERKARRLGISAEVIFTGIKDRQEIEEIYLASDIFVLPSLFDTFALVVLEAMAAGLPVVVSGNVGAGDLVCEGENGFVVGDPRDIFALKERILFLFDGGNRERMGQKAAKTAGENTWEGTCERIAAVYERILSGKEDA